MRRQISWSTAIHELGSKRSPTLVNAQGFIDRSILMRKAVFLAKQHRSLQLRMRGGRSDGQTPAEFWRACMAQGLRLAWRRVKSDQSDHEVRHLGRLQARLPKRSWQVEKPAIISRLNRIISGYSEQLDKAANAIAVPSERSADPADGIEAAERSASATERRRGLRGR